MRIRWKDILLTAGTIVCLGAFNASCVPFWETRGETVEKDSEKTKKEEPPLGTMDRMEQQAEQGELAPPAQDMEPSPPIQPHP